MKRLKELLFVLQVPDDIKEGRNSFNGMGIISPLS
jgi:hypothetical protein